MVMAGSPAHREADVVLRDGSTVRVRPAGPEDARAVERLLRGLSDRSRWLRYFSGAPNIDKAVQWATELDDDRRYGLVATSGGDGRVIGHIGFEREPDRPERAEVAMEVADAMQDKGLGTILLGQIAEAARDVGVQVLGAEVLPQNHQMIKVLRDCGFPVKTRTVLGALLIESPPLCPKRRWSGSSGASRWRPRRPCAPSWPVLGGGDRGVAASRHRRRRAVPQPRSGAPPPAWRPRWLSRATRSTGSWSSGWSATASSC